MKENLMGVDPEIKNQINKEGWQKEGEGEAAVIIGKKEEMDILKENLENEGKCADVATYVRMNKKVVVPAENASEKIKDNKGKGWIMGGKQLLFIDVEGNIAKVDIDYQKISSMPKDIYQDKLSKIFEKELKKCGFDMQPREDFSELFGEILETTKTHKDKLEEESKERKKIEFDF
jgi:hypothetical protein